MGLGSMLSESSSSSFRISKHDSSPTVVDVANEINSRYPTDLLTLIIANARKAADAGKEKTDGTFYDPSNNYFIGSDPKDEDGPSLSAGILKTENGHYLFLLNATMEMAGLYSDEPVFFDVDWKNGIISPLPEYSVKQYRTPFSSHGTVTRSLGFETLDEIYIGYEITDGLFLSLTSFFAWDGSKHNYRGSEINLPKQKILPADLKPESLKYFAFHDVDDDGNSEIFFSNEDHSTETVAVIRAYEKKESEILSKGSQQEFEFYEKGMSTKGSCGSGCTSSDYVLVTESSCTEKLNVYTLTDPQNNRDVTFTLTDQNGEKKINQEKAEEFIKKLGKKKSVKLDWQPLLGISF